LEFFLFQTPTKRPERRRRRGCHIGGKWRRESRSSERRKEVVEEKRR
jgi:hypothetical protein